MSSRPPENEAELIELIRALDVRAPDRLHSRTAALIASQSGGARGTAGRRARLGVRLGASLGLAAGVVAILVVLVLAGGSSAPISVRETAALTLRAATKPAPPQSGTARGELMVAVDGVGFPYWEERFGWRSSGARTDRIGGRLVQTVFYSDGGGGRVGYAIVSGKPPPVHGGQLHWQGTTSYRLLQEDGSQMVMWLRQGHLCIMGGRGVSDATLLRLAGSEEDGDET